MTHINVITVNPNQTSRPGRIINRTGFPKRSSQTFPALFSLFAQSLARGKKEPVNDDPSHRFQSNINKCHRPSFNNKKRLKRRKEFWEVREREMSGGIARGRLTEERKAWRKNHPHVRTLSSSFSTFEICSFVFWICFGVYSLITVSIRVLWRGRRHWQMDRSIWWCGTVIYPESKGYVCFLTHNSFWKYAIGFRFWLIEENFLV